MSEIKNEGMPLLNTPLAGAAKDPNSHQSALNVPAPNVLPTMPAQTSHQNIMTPITSPNLHSLLYEPAPESIPAPPHPDRRPLDTSPPRFVPNPLAEFCHFITPETMFVPAPRQTFTAEQLGIPLGVLCHRILTRYPEWTRLSSMADEDGILRVPLRAVIPPTTLVDQGNGTGLEAAEARFRRGLDVSNGVQPVACVAIPVCLLVSPGPRGINTYCTAPSVQSDIMANQGRHMPANRVRHMMANQRRRMMARQGTNTTVPHGVILTTPQGMNMAAAHGVNINATPGNAPPCSNVFAYCQ